MCLAFKDVVDNFLNRLKVKLEIDKTAFLSIPFNLITILFYHKLNKFVSPSRHFQTRHKIYVLLSTIECGVKSGHKTFKLICLF